MNITNKEIFRPKINGIETKETEKLFQIIRNDQTANASIQCLTELIYRQDKQMQELKEELSQTKQKIQKLESKLNPPKRKSGRKQKQYFLNGILIDDDELIRLIDGEYITIRRKQRPIAKRKWEDLEKAILDFYESQKTEEKRKKITLRTLYPEWFEYKWQDTNNSNYMKHIDGEWKRFYLKDDIIDKPIVEFTALQLKEWARNKIITERMTKKQYYNMAIIIRQSLDYLVERGELSVNHYNEFKVNTSPLH